MDLQDVQGLLRNRVCDVMRSARLFYEDDHWQRGKGLTIKKPQNQEILNRMEEGFASQNKVAEVVDRKTDGILGREPLWKIIPKTQKETTDPEQRSVDEMTAALVEWWNNRGMLQILRESHTNASLERRAELRPFVASAFKNESGELVSQTSLTAALDLLHFENVSPMNAGVFLEENSLRPFSLCKAVRKDTTYIDFSFVDADGITRFKTFTESEFEKFVTANFSTSLAKYIALPTGIKEVGGDKMNLGGKLMLFEVDMQKAMITKSFQSKQKQYNLSLTMKGRNTYTAGFRERHFLNADEPDDLNLGAGSATYHQGVPVRDNGGEIIGIATPSVTVVDPVDPSNFIKSEDSLDLQMLAEVDQRHVGMADDATASGKSRVDAREEYRNTLVKSKYYVDAEGRYIIELAMMFAASLTNRTAEFEKFRCDFDSIVNAGKPSVEEMAENRAAYEAGEISLETLRSRNGTEDTDAEDSKVKSEDGYELTILDKALDVYAKATGALDLSVIVNLLPIAEEKKKLILAGIVEPVKEPPPVV